MKTSEVIKYFLFNFVIMLFACLLIDLITYVSCETYDIQKSLIVASIGAFVFTVIKFIIEYRKKK